MPGNTDLLSSANSVAWEAKTSLQVDKHLSFKWRIENFSRYPISGRKPIQSPTFGCSDSEWALDLNPYGKEDDLNKAISVYLINLSPDTEITAEFNIHLVDKHGINQYSKKDEKVFNSEKDSWGYESFVDREILLREKSEELLPDDVLTLFCEVSFTADIIQGEPHLVSQQRECKEDTTVNKRAIDILVNDFEALLREQKICDVTLEVSNEKLPAHKTVLVARSKVFAAMFEHDTKESQSSMVTIVDIEPAVMSDLLRYIYSGSVREMSVEKATGLYVAADKYDLPELKSQCADFLLRNLSLDNAVDVAVLADAHNDGMIINSVKKFARNHAKLLSTEKWKQLVKQNARLAYEITKCLVPQSLTS